jgi:predicted RNase H-like HicB family nuclease
MPAMARQSVRVRTEYAYDPESRNWGFAVPSLGIVGGADTREAAEREAVGAIAFTLESENEAPPPTEGEVSYVGLTIETA